MQIIDKYLRKTILSQFIMVLSVLMSLFVFITNNLINYQIGSALLVGSFIGGYFGAHISIIKGNGWIKMMVAGGALLMGARLVFG